MFRGFKKFENKILVGTVFDDHWEDCIPQLTEFAKATNSQIRLAHVIRPIEYHRTIASHYYESINYETLNLEETFEKDFREKLAKLQKKFVEQDVPCDTKILWGPTAGSLMAEAKSWGASMIVAKLRSSPKQYMPYSLSTIINLMTFSEVPVMTLPHEGELDLSKKDPKILIADNLREETENIVKIAVNFGNMIGPSHFVHFHVHNQAKQEILRLGDTILNAMLENKAKDKTDFVPDKLLKDIEADINSKFEKRYDVAAADIAHGKHHYIQETVYNNVREALEEKVKDYGPDFIIFGKHHTLHAKPMAIGKIPFYTMLNFDIPTLTIPEATKTLVLAAKE